MDAHPHAYRSGNQRVAGRGRGRQRTLSRREGDEECVTLRVNLHPAMPAEGRSQDAPVLRQRPRISIGPQFHQLRGAFPPQVDEHGALYDGEQRVPCFQLCDTSQVMLISRPRPADGSPH